MQVNPRSGGFVMGAERAQRLLVGGIVLQYP